MLEVDVLSNGRHLVLRGDCNVELPQRGLFKGGPSAGIQRVAAWSTGLKKAPRLSDRRWIGKGAVVA